MHLEISNIDPAPTPLNKTPISIAVNPGDPDVHVIMPSLVDFNPLSHIPLR
jgi:hypothetical protein